MPLTVYRRLVVCHCPCCCALTLQVFDKERSGFVSVAEFRHINELGDEKLSEEVVEAMIAFADRDGVGQINYEDFVKRLVGAP